MESTDTIVIAKLNKLANRPPPSPAPGSIKHPLKCFWGLIEDLRH